MRPPLTPGLLLAVALSGCPGEQGKALWGSTPGVSPADDSGSSSVLEESSGTTPVEESTSTTDAALSTSTGAEATATSDATVWDMGVPDFGGVQPAGCRGKIDFLFAISAGGNMQLHQSQLIAGFPGFMDAIEEQLPDFDVHILVANPNSKPGWLMDDCSLCNDDCDPKGSPPTCGAELTVCDRTIGAGITYPAGIYASNRRCDLSSGQRYIIGGTQDMTAEFNCIAQVGAGGSDAVGRAMIGALQPEMNDPESDQPCNSGFLRDDALLVVTLIQDGYDELSPGTVEEWIETLRAAKHGDDDAFAVLVVTTDVDTGYGGLCHPDKFNTEKNRLRLLADGVRHGFISSICEESYVPFFTEHVADLAELCDNFAPPG